jgi:hypothetical protein
MTVKEMLITKQVLEAEVQELLSEFIADTGVRAAGMTVKTTEINGRETIVDVNVLIK